MGEVAQINKQLYPAGKLKAILDSMLDCFLFHLRIQLLALADACECTSNNRGFVIISRKRFDQVRLFEGTKAFQSSELY